MELTRLRLFPTRKRSHGLLASGSSSYVDKLNFCFLGGTFALYSLICRYANVSVLPNRQPADERISSFRLKLPTPELERALTIKETLERTSSLQTILLLLVLMGTSMVIGDGILTPAISGI